MGLTEIERKEIVTYRLENAKTTFAEIPILLENKLYKTAANRLYYSCYYAATALLINNGHEAHTHTGVKTLLSLHFISTNIIDKSFSKMYRQLYNLRQTGDYEDLVNIDEDDVKPFIEPAKEFIAIVEKLISSSQQKI